MLLTEALFERLHLLKNLLLSWASMSVFNVRSRYFRTNGRKKPDEVLLFLVRIPSQGAKRSSFHESSACR